MASSIDATKPVNGNATTSSVRNNFAAAKSEIEALQARRNNAGQVKVNYGTTLALVGFVDGVIKTFNISAATPSLSAAPTTTWPFSAPNKTYADVFDAARGTLPVAGRLIENPVPGQVHLWRFQVAYSSKNGGETGPMALQIFNPVSGFVYPMPISLPTSATAGVFNCIGLTIADDASIPAPQGYILQASCGFTDPDLRIEITSITRISLASEITTALP